MEDRQPGESGPKVRAKRRCTRYVLLYGIVAGLGGHPRIRFSGLAGSTPNRSFHSVPCTLAPDGRDPIGNKGEPGLQARDSYSSARSVPGAIADGGTGGPATESRA